MDGYKPCYICDGLKSRQRKGGIWLCYPCHIRHDTAIKNDCLIEDLRDNRILTEADIDEAEVILNGVINFDPKFDPFNPDALEQALQKYTEQHGVPMPVDEFMRMING